MGRPGPDVAPLQKISQFQQSSRLSPGDVERNLQLETDRDLLTLGTLKSINTRGSGQSTNQIEVIYHIKDDKSMMGRL
ncbi:hypothetical protein J6590_003204 [Homalodisca vitripennis]|nr:hypothetical protein J6590_003204 [Homalodisca vitripennis]